MVIRQPHCLSFPTQNRAGIADVCSIQDSSLKSEDLDWLRSATARFGTHPPGRARFLGSFRKTLRIARFRITPSLFFFNSKIRHHRCAPRMEPFPIRQLLIGHHKRPVEQFRNLGIRIVPQELLQRLMQSHKPVGTVKCPEMTQTYGVDIDSAPVRRRFSRVSIVDGKETLSINTAKGV